MFKYSIFKYFQPEKWVLRGKWPDLLHFRFQHCSGAPLRKVPVSSILLRAVYLAKKMLNLVLPRSRSRFCKCLIYFLDLFRYIYYLPSALFVITSWVSFLIPPEVSSRKIFLRFSLILTEIPSPSPPPPPTRWCLGGWPCLSLSSSCWSTSSTTWQMSPQTPRAWRQSLPGCWVSHDIKSSNSLFIGCDSIS